MPNPEHLEILRQGVLVWNEWRKRHPEIQPYLNDADLSGAYFRYAQLGRVNLSHANLSRADLIGALLNGAYLDGADLSSADLKGVKLGSAYLGDADLSNADLLYANFQNSILHGADFTKSRWGGTILSEVDLSEVKGLETVTHDYPSTIGIDTIYKSQGNIPEVFLRGCGVPEDFITYMRSLVVQPIQFYKSFISYSSKDQKFADRLYADLQNKGVRCWLASEDLKIGEKIRFGIDEAIRMHDKLLLVLSKHSVASDWVEQEVETALARERTEKHTVLFPIRLDAAVMKVESGWPALVRNTRNIGDFRQWKNHDSYQKAFDRLLRDLKAEDRQAAQGQS